MPRPSSSAAIACGRRSAASSNSPRRFARCTASNGESFSVGAASARRSVRRACSSLCASSSRSQARSASVAGVNSRSAKADDSAGDGAASSRLRRTTCRRVKALACCPWSRRPYASRSACAGSSRTGSAGADDATPGAAAACGAPALLWKPPAGASKAGVPAAVPAAPASSRRGASAVIARCSPSSPWNEPNGVTCGAA